MADNVYIKFLKTRISGYESAIKELQEKGQDLQTTQLEIKVEELHVCLDKMQKLEVKSTSASLFDTEMNGKLDEMAGKIEKILVEVGK